jgi:hypothetical protein
MNVAVHVKYIVSIACNLFALSRCLNLTAVKTPRKAYVFDLL